LKEYHTEPVKQEMKPNSDPANEQKRESLSEQKRESLSEEHHSPPMQQKKEPQHHSEPVEQKKEPKLKDAKLLIKTSEVSRIKI
jgi:hypothetical protein